jgi:hypothetical protein
MSGLIANRYRIDSLLEYGGTVYQAFDVPLGRTVAIKMIPGHRLEETEIVEGFQQQAAAAARLAHSNVVRVYDVTEHETRRQGTKNSQPVIVMEYVPGRNLLHYIRQREALPSENLDDPFDRKLDIVVQVCRGLHHGHEQGMVHGAINPQNIRVTPAGEARILNFGIAPVGEASVRRYMSPEQLEAGAGIDRRSDVFSLGVVLYELLALVPPFAVEPTGEFQPIEVHLPDSAPELIEAVNRSLARDPADRFPDCKAFETALTAVRHRVPREEDRGAARLDEEGGRRVRETLNSARAAGDEGYFEWALALLDDVLRSDPGNEEAASLRATVLVGKERREKAAGLLEQAREAQSGGEVAAAGLLALEAWKLDPRSGDAEKLFEQTQAALRGRREGKELPRDHRVSRMTGLTALRQPPEPASEPEELPSGEAAEFPEPGSSDWTEGDSRPRSWASRFSRVIVPLLGLALLAGGVWLAIRDETGPTPVTASPGAPALTPAPGTVALDIVPWSTVESIIRVSDGRAMEHEELETPCVLSLPAGEYLLTVSHPEFGSHRLPLDVRSGELTSVEYSLLSLQEMQEELSPVEGRNPSDRGDAGR